MTSPGSGIQPQIFIVGSSNFFEIDGAHEIFSAVVEELASSSESSHSHDRMQVQNEAVSVVGGYLNLCEKQGWEDRGNDPRVGAAFVRCMLTDYVQNFPKYTSHLAEKGMKTDEFETIMKRVVDGFENIGNLIKSPFCKEQPEDGHRPKTNRVRYDEGVKGWKNHTVCRMVGNIASRYETRFPFFEILVNSARDTVENISCRPFRVTIFDNETELDKRRQSLAAGPQLDVSTAHHTFYSSSLKGPDQFMKTTRLKIGPNAKRILEGLEFLNKVEMYAQRTRNCWIKQPMRCLLVGLYLEILSVRKELSPPEAWKMAMIMYKEIQKRSGIPIIQGLMDQVRMSAEMKDNALKEIEYRMSF